MLPPFRLAATALLGLAGCFGGGESGPRAVAEAAAAEIGPAMPDARVDGRLESDGAVRFDFSTLVPVRDEGGPPPAVALERLSPAAPRADADVAVGAEPPVFESRDDERAVPAPPPPWIVEPPGVGPRERASGRAPAGAFLYVASPAEHTVLRYELVAIRAASAASPAPGRVAIERDVRVRHPEGEARVELLSPCALVAREGWLYVGYRSSSVVVRFRLDADGRVVWPDVAELVAVFGASDGEGRPGAGLAALAFDGAGELYASCAEEGRIWRVGVPDPSRPFFAGRATGRSPFVDLRVRAGPTIRPDGLAFDERGRLLVRATSNDSKAAPGEIYRVTLLR